MARELIAERITIGRRYVRAVDVIRDLDDVHALDGYMLTPSVQDAIRRLVVGLQQDSTQRAFRVTGPYGSGKSSFALLLARLFLEGDGGGPARELIADVVKVEELPYYRPKVMVGRHASLTTDLAIAVQDVARSEFGEDDELTIAASNVLEAEEGFGPSDTKIVLDCLVKCSEKLYRRSGRGLLLIVDEMGRYVEFSVSNPNRDDPSMLQQLAERAGGSRKGGLAVIGCLHHQFSDYVATMGDWLEGEWRRSSERYEEIAFHESHEQLLYLLAEAIVARQGHSGAVKTAARSLYRKAGRRGLFAMASADISALGERLYPFHPGALLCLWSCSRRFGQNERSIFTFLQSSEPFGYKEFAHRTAYGSRNWYRIDDLYDHLASQGSLLFQSKDRERRWEMGQDALLVSGDLSAEVQSVLKAVSVIAVLEPLPGLLADVETLAWLLGCQLEVIRNALEVLEKRGLLHKRESQQDWSLWSRSSVDLDHWMEKALTAVPVKRRLEEEISRYSSSRPIVAQRHYHRTGTFRSFAVNIGEGSTQSDSSIDGQVLVYPIYPDEDRTSAREKAALTSKRLGALTLIRVQPITPGHLAIARHLSCWKWVRENCGELRIDDFARAEVERRIREMESELRLKLLSVGDNVTNANSVEWLYEGEAEAIDSRASLNRFLSDMCDRVFHSSPILRNELINRAKLSSAVAAARSRLLNLMLDKEEEKFLGLTGSPPERTIYLSMFHATGLHRLVRGKYRFCKPRHDDPFKWRAAWRHVDAKAVEGESIGVDVVIASLNEPPIGLRAGPALLLIATYMLHHRSSIALMERGSFQPEITQAHFIRLAKSPKNFALRRIAATENEKVLKSLVEGLSIWADDRPQINLKAVIAAMYRWWEKLSDYARTTQSVSPTAKNVRAVLRKAKEPIELIFNQLPQACNVIENEGIDVLRYTMTLDIALTELDDALKTLRDRVEANMNDVFVTRNLDELRKQFTVDYEAHRSELGSYKLRAFVDRALKGDVDDATWVDGMAGLVVGRRPDRWDDTTEDHFAFEIRTMAQELIRRLALVREKKALQAPVTAIHLTTPGGEEQSLYLRDGVTDQSSLKERIRDMLVQAERPDALLVDLLGEIMAKQDRERLK